MQHHATLLAVKPYSHSLHFISHHACSEYEAITFSSELRNQWPTFRPKRRTSAIVGALQSLWTRIRQQFQGNFSCSTFVMLSSSVTNFSFLLVLCKLSHYREQQWQQMHNRACDPYITLHGGRIMCREPRGAVARSCCTVRNGHKLTAGSVGSCHSVPRRGIQRCRWITGWFVR